jgi:uncharacterized LabA/DUF88 family protein
MKSNSVFHEKGVDVEIAIAILVAAYEDLADCIILVSSDTHELRNEIVEELMLI